MTIDQTTLRLVRHYLSIPGLQAYSDLLGRLREMGHDYTTTRRIIRRVSEGGRGKGPREGKDKGQCTM